MDKCGFQMGDWPYEAAYAPLVQIVLLTGTDELLFRYLSLFVEVKIG